MTVTDEELMAYVDGELDASRSDAVRREMTADAELAQRVAQQQALRDRLRRAFDRTLEEPVPARLTELINDDRVIQFATAQPKRPARSAWLGGLALAAGVVLGVALGPALMNLPWAQPEIVTDGSRLTARGALADTLSERLSSEQAATDAIRLGASFVARNGEYCRTFVSRRDGRGIAGLACREGASWRILATQVVTGASEGSEDYREAATAMPPAVLAAGDALMAGEALDARGEAEARDRQWTARAATR